MSVVRYQVFVSSTYTDLQEERGKVFNSLMMMNCIPAGMEIFTAFDEKQLEFIKKIIDESDYYVLIVGGRYGSTTEAGISYTEHEYDYAVSINKPILSFIHKTPDDIPQGKTDRNDSKRALLEAFTEKVRNSGRNVMFWNTGDELSTQVSISLMQTMRTKPAVGWIRGDTAASVEILTELNTMRNQYQDLSDKYKTLKGQNSQIIEDIAPLTDEFTIRFDVKTNYNSTKRRETQKLSWGEIFKIIGPAFFAPHGVRTIETELSKYCREVLRIDVHSRDIVDEDLYTIKVQLIAYNFLHSYNAGTVGNGGIAEFLTLTDTGKQALMSLKAVKKTSPA